MKKNLLYEGKAKLVYQAKDQDQVVVVYKDSATAFNGIKKQEFKNKGILNNKISSIIFKYLNDNGVKSHFIKQIDDNSQLCLKAKVIPLEFIVRNISAGHMSKRLGLKEGLVLDKPVLEICYKNDSLNDPLINNDHAFLLKLISKEDLDYAYNQALIINELLIKLFKDIKITLVDFKLEFGLNENNEVILVDEFSPDNARLWDIDTKQSLDKDVFRKDLNDLISTYTIVLNRLLER